MLTRCPDRRTGGPPPNCSGRKLGPAARAASADDCASADRRHTRAEAVTAGADQVARLKRALHRSLPSKSDNEKRPPLAGRPCWAARYAGFARKSIGARTGKIGTTPCACTAQAPVGDTSLFRPPPLQPHIDALGPFRIAQYQRCADEGERQAARTRQQTDDRRRDQAQRPDHEKRHPSHRIAFDCAPAPTDTHNIRCGQDWLPLQGSEA